MYANGVLYKQDYKKLKNRFGLEQDKDKAENMSTNIVLDFS